MDGKIAGIAIACLLLGVSWVSGQAQNGIGTFDIEKVRHAVQGSVDSSGLDSATDTIPKAGLLPSRKSNGLGWTAVRICMYLILMIGAIFIVTLIIRRVGAAGRSKIGSGSMDTLEVLSTGQNRTILLVRIMDKVYVLGQTQNQITLLDKIEGAPALEIISSSKGALSMNQFKDVFNNFMGKIKKSQ